MRALLHRAQRSAASRHRAEDDIQIEGVETPPGERAAKDGGRHDVRKRELECVLDGPAPARRWRHGTSVQGINGQSTSLASGNDGDIASAMIGSTANRNDTCTIDEQNAAINGRGRAWRSAPMCSRSERSDR